MKKYILFLFAAIVAVPVFAIGQSAPDSGTIVEWLTPFIVLAATWLVKVVRPNIPGFWTLTVVTALSGLVTWLTNLLAAPDLSWMAQFGLGLAATFVHQIYKQLSAE